MAEDFAHLFDVQENNLERKKFYKPFSKLKIPASVEVIQGIHLTDYDNSVTYVTKFYDIEVDNNNRHFCSVEGVLFSKDMKTLICYPCGKMLNKIEKGVKSFPLQPNYLTYVVPNVEVIGDAAFMHSKGLTKVILPQTVKVIKEYAFAYSGVEELKLPAGLHTIESDAITCTKISILDIPDSVTEVNTSLFCVDDIVIVPANLPKINWDSSNDYLDSYPIIACRGINLAIRDLGRVTDYMCYENVKVLEDGTVKSKEGHVIYRPSEQ